MVKVWNALPYVVLACILAIICYCTCGGGEKNMGLKITSEDGFIEWGTCVAFGITGLLGMCAAVMKRKMLTKNQLIFLVVFSIICFLAVGEELSWGERIFGFAPPENMETTSSSAVTFGHNDVTMHNLDFKFGKVSFSIGGMLFGVTLIVALAIHGIVLPILYKKRHPKIVKFVDKLGLFLPPLNFGILVTAAALMFYILRRTTIDDMTEPNEFKEFFVPVVYAAIVAVTFFNGKTKGERVCLEFLFILFMLGITASVTKM
ncbi:MAG TPA: hypothetical protein PKK48_01505 [Phycisphaerae bacterium]|nr:hypothetical protein [Phycisphaerae bacterium]HPS52442.1 hypothetical protein [Phycisphaerae bacterium]